MIRVTYTAGRGLVGLQGAGDPVVLEASAVDITPGREVQRSVQTALGGARETIYNHGRRTWSVTLGPLYAATLDAVLSFLEAVEGGEAFTFEPEVYGSAPSLDVDLVTPRLRVAELVAAQLSSEGYTLARLGGVGTGGADDYYTVGFTVVALP